MPDIPNEVATFRARLDHHNGVKARAEADRAALIADRAEAGSLLDEAELDAVDMEIARLADVAERASSRIALLAPALERAERVEAEAAARMSASALAENDRATVAGISGSDPMGGAETVVRLSAARAPVLPPNPKLFDEPPAPTCRRDDAAWWAAREARERAERRRHTAAAYGEPAPQGERRYPSYAGLAGNPC